MLALDFITVGSWTLLKGRVLGCWLKALLALSGAAQHKGWHKR
jgi:hypothetical protein